MTGSDVSSDEGAGPSNSSQKPMPVQQEDKIYENIRYGVQYVTVILSISSSLRWGPISQYKHR